MPLLLPHTYEGLDGKIRSVVEDIVAKVQTWATQVDGVNAAERLNELAGGLAGLTSVPTGAGFAWYTNTAPSGYLICDGSAVSRVTYVKLFELWGVSFGSGDGVTTFTLPDLRRRFLMGKSSSDTLGGTGGTFDHTHTLSGSTASESAHTHGAGTLANGSPSSFDELATAAYDPGSGNLVPSATHTHTISGSTAAGSAHSHGVGTLAAAASNPPYFVVNWIVKT